MIDQLIPLLVLLTTVVLVVFLISLGIAKLLKKNLHFGFISRNKNMLSCIVALTATLGSLYYSEIMNYLPCELCWHQRIAIYPLVVLFAVAYVRKQDVFWFALPFIIIGIFFAGYHYATQFYGVETSCVIGEVSCADKLEFHFGFMTIPVMALVALCAILVLQLHGRRFKSV